MSLDSIVSVTISTATQAVTQAGFGVPCIVGYHTRFAERIRFYSGISGMVSDGFVASDPEYLAAQAIFAQSPAPSRIAVGRRTSTPTQIVEVTPTAKNSRTYKVTINGTEFSYASDANATVAEIVAGLVAAINAGAEPVTASNVGPDQRVRLTADVAGAAFRLEVSDNDGNPNGMGLWAKVQDLTADAGIADDLGAIALENNEWYGVALTFQGEAEIKAAAAWVEANKKLMVVACADTDMKGAAVDDVASDLETAAYARTAVLYHPKPHQYAGAAWMGALLPHDPGSETWKFKTLAGVDSVVLTETEITNLKNKHANWYTTVGGVAVTFEGWSSAGEFLDVTRFVDWLRARLQERIYGLLVSAKKVPYTDPGVALIEAAVRAQLLEGVSVGGLASDPAPVVTVPKVADVSTNDRAARLLPDVSFTATLAGAIHSLELTGTVSV